MRMHGTKVKIKNRHVLFSLEATEFLKDISVGITGFWDMAPCCFEACYRYIGEY
jgi:hypothetical protein